MGERWRERGGSWAVAVGYGVRLRRRTSWGFRERGNLGRNVTCSPQDCNIRLLNLCSSAGESPRGADRFLLVAQKGVNRVDRDGLVWRCRFAASFQGEN